jgi:hypothetical protein
MARLQAMAVGLILLVTVGCDGDKLPGTVRSYLDSYVPLFEDLAEHL